MTFSDTATGPTRAKFGTPGAYVLELSATDGEKANSLTVERQRDLTPGCLPTTFERRPGPFGVLRADPQG